MPPEATTIITPEATTPPLTDPIVPETPTVETPVSEPVVSVRELTDEEILERAAALDRKKILAHNKFAGILGSQADELFKKRYADAEAKRLAEEAAKEQARLRKLRDGNPLDYVDEIKKKEEFELQQQIVNNQIDAVLYAHFQKLPEEIKKELDGKQFPSRQDYLDAVTESLAEYKATLKTPSAIEAERARLKAEHEEALKVRDAKEKADRTRWENEQVEAIRKEILSKTVGSEPSPDQGSGSPARGALTNEEWQQHKKDRTWTLANIGRIRDAMNAGRLMA